MRPQTFTHFAVLTSPSSPNRRGIAHNSSSQGKNLASKQQASKSDAADNPHSSGYLARIPQDIKEKAFRGFSGQEKSRLEQCFKDPEFVKLFEDYMQEISDPKLMEVCS